MDVDKLVIDNESAISEEQLSTLDIDQLVHYKNTSKHSIGLCDQIIERKINSLQKSEALLTTCRLDLESLVENIIEKNNDINFNIQDENGFTPFHWTCLNKNNKLVELIISCARRNLTIDLSIRDKDDNKGFYYWKEKFMPDTFL